MDHNSLGQHSWNLHVPGQHCLQGQGLNALWQVLPGHIFQEVLPGQPFQEVLAGQTFARSFTRTTFQGSFASTTFPGISRASPEAEDSTIPGYKRTIQRCDFQVAVACHVRPSYYQSPHNPHTHNCHPRLRNQLKPSICKAGNLLMLLGVSNVSVGRLVVATDCHLENDAHMLTTSISCSISETLQRLLLILGCELHRPFHCRDFHVQVTTDVHFLFT